MVRLPRILYVASAALAVVVAGCEIEATVRVVDAVRPRLVVTFDRGKPACVQGLTVAAAGQQRPIWAIRRVDLRTDAWCMDKFDYGITPGGYETAVAPLPLVPGQRYEISATGTGWHATTPLVHSPGDRRGGAR